MIIRARHECDVIVAGAGPVGLLAAHALARRGAKVHIFEEAPREATRSYALALHPSTLRVFEQEGLLDAVRSRAHRIDAIAFYENSERRLELDLSTLTTPPRFGLVLPQNELEATLVAELERLGTKIHWNHRVDRFVQDDEKVTAEILRYTKVGGGYAVQHSEWLVDKSWWETGRFLIGADGHGSIVRRDLGITFEEVGPTEFFAVFQVQAEKKADNEARIVIGEDNTNVLWPLGGNRWRFSFQVRDADAEEWTRTKSRGFVQGMDDTDAASEDLFARLLEERAPWFRAAIHSIDWSAVVRFERRVAGSFGHGRTWIVGDAAHMAEPIGVQSMNSGLREAHDLARAITRTLRGEAPVAHLIEVGDRHHAAWRSPIRPTQKPTSHRWIEQRQERILKTLPSSPEDAAELLAAKLL